MGRVSAGPKFDRPRRIGTDDALEDFDCGASRLNLFLQRRARANEGRASRTYVLPVLTSAGTSAIAGYYSLAADAQLREALPGAFRRNMPEKVPAILLGRLAVDRRYQGLGLGRALLTDAIARAIDISEMLGARFVLVSAISESAARFYERHGFKRLDDERRLFGLPIE